MSLRNIYLLVPEKFQRDLKMASFFSLCYVLLDFLSIVLLVPVFVGIFNLQSQLPVHKATETIRRIFQDHQTILLASLLAFFVVKNWMSVKMVRFQSDFAYRLSNALSVDLLRRYFQKPLVETKSEKNSELVKDILFVPNNFVSYVLSSWMTLLSEMLLLVMVLSILLFMDPAIALLLCLIVALIAGLTYWFEKRSLESINQEVSAQYNRNTSHLLDAVNGYPEIKINQMESYFLKLFGQSNGNLNERYATLQTNRLSKPRYTETILVFFIVSIFLLSQYLWTVNGSGAVFVSFLFAAALKIIPGVNRILIALTNLRTNAYTVDILQNSIPRPTNAVAETDIGFTDTIRLQNISVRFNAKPVLENLSLTIPKASIVGIFGDSGNGKSTLINSIATLITPDSGTICVDSEAITPATAASWLSKIGYVSQSPFIFEGSILDNLQMDQQAEPEILDKYLELFGLDETIARLPQKLDTFIGSNGYHLSGGQLQRLALVRCLIRKPQILLLDEATNQLDPNLRKKTTQTIQQIATENRMTVICISHNREELEDFCQAIYELKKGALIPV